MGNVPSWSNIKGEKLHFKSKAVTIWIRRNIFPKEILSNMVSVDRLWILKNIILISGHFPRTYKPFTEPFMLFFSGTLQKTQAVSWQSRCNSLTLCFSRAFPFFVLMVNNCIRINAVLNNNRQTKEIKGLITFQALRFLKILPPQCLQMFTITE